MSQNKLEVLIKTLARHPYIIAFAICIALNPFYMGAEEFVPVNALMIECGLLAAGAFFIIYKRYLSGRYRKKQAATLAVMVTLFIMVGSVLYTRSKFKGLWLLVGGCVIILGVFYFIKSKKYVLQLNSLMILSLSFMLKYFYVFSTSIYTRQHDVNSFLGIDGHAGYIEYIVQNHSLPPYDPRDFWQFSHPPLHHVISATWIFINEKVFGVGYDPARESLQTLTLFYSMCIVITAYRILRHFKLKGAALYAPLVIIAFHPAFILLSGSINNDVLSVVFIMGAVYSTLKWYDNQNFKNILKIALCVGLGMMTKLSAALVAPPIALVFLWVFIRKIKTSWKQLIGQYAAFGAVCVPLGLWFEVMNFVKFHLPITYVQKMLTTETQYLGTGNYLSRITDFSPKQLHSVFIQWLWYDEAGKAQNYNEHNPIITLLKNSVFGEFINESSFPKQAYMLSVAKILFWLSVIIAGAALIFAVVMCIRKCAMNSVHKAFFVVFYLVMMLNIYKMSYDYPFTCTMNFRYITPTVITGALFYGMFVNRMGEKKTNGSLTAVKVLTIAPVVFALLVTVFYVGVCRPVQ